LGKIFEALVFNDFWTGVAKTLFFGYFIVMFACYRGLNTAGVRAAWETPPHGL